MGCLPYEGCERGFIEPFILNLNQMEHAQFHYVTCLDKLPSGRQKPQPEILYAEGLTGDRLVIEAKHLTWPRRYVQRHQTDHYIVENIADGVRPLVQNAPYELCLPYLFRGKAAQVETFIRSVIQAISSLIGVVDAGEIIGSKYPGREWTFRRQNPSERDEWDPPTGLYALWYPPDGLDPEVRQHAKRDLASDLQRHYAACTLKFADYMDARRILLLSLVGNVYFDSMDWADLIGTDTIPDAITEIWTADYTWVTETEQAWNFDRVYPAPSSDRLELRHHV